MVQPSLFCFGLPCLNSSHHLKPEFISDPSRLTQLPNMTGAHDGYPFTLNLSPD